MQFPDKCESGNDFSALDTEIIKGFMYLRSVHVLNGWQGISVWFDSLFLNKKNDLISRIFLNEAFIEIILTTSIIKTSHRVNSFSHKAPCPSTLSFIVCSFSFKWKFHEPVFQEDAGSCPTVFHTLWFQALTILDTFLKCLINSCLFLWGNCSLVSM